MRAENGNRVRDSIAEVHGRLSAYETILWQQGAEGEFSVRFSVGAKPTIDSNGQTDHLISTLQQARVHNGLAQEKPTLLGAVLGRIPGVLQMVWHSRIEQDDHEYTIECFQTLCDRLSETDENAGKAPDSTEFMTRWPSSVVRFHRSLIARDTADVIANETLHLTGSDRVCVAVTTGKRTKIIAVSGQESPRRHSRQVKMLSRLATQVVLSRERLLYQGDADHLPAKVRELLVDYVHEARATMLLLVPLVPPLAITKAIGEEQSFAPPNPIGCLILEQKTGYAPRPELEQRVEMLRAHMASALANSIKYSRIPFARPLTAIGRMLSWFRGRRIWFAVAGIFIAIGIGIALAFVPWTYHVSADGQIMPVVRQDVFAPENGVVADILVNDGMEVDVGVPLIRIRSDELQQAHVAATNALLEKTKLVRVLEGRIAEAERLGATDQLSELNAEVTRARIEQIGTEASASIIQARIDSLTIVAPFAGRVVGFRMEQKLKDLPVVRGERLLEVIQPRLQRLEIEIPEYRMGHIQHAMQDSVTGTLNVNYLLASDVEVRRHGMLTRIATRVDESTENGTVVLGFTELPPSTVSERHIGARVNARIECGERSLGYVLFGDVVEFVQRRLWWL